jgi:rhamnulokinase
VGGATGTGVSSAAGASSAVMAAVDLGASGGRVIAGRVSASGVELHEVSRFPNQPVRAGGTLHWDILGLYRSVCSGLTAAASTFSLASAGIDTWGVDYGLLDAAGALVGNPVHYRDSRTDGVTVPVSAETLYAVTGIQHLPINTIYQLAAAAGTPALSAAKTLLLIPDLLAYWLTGAIGAEVTNASTTGLLDVTTRTWAAGLIEQAGIPAGIFPPLRQPGDLIGPITAGQAGVGAGGGAHGPGALVGGGKPVPLVAVGSHDTASAVVAVPASGPHFAYISSGTWSLVGLELDAPVLTEESRLANFTNEGGIDGTIRYLRNVTGLWLLQECVRTWGVSVESATGPTAEPAAGRPATGPMAGPDARASAGPPDLGSLLTAAAAEDPLRYVFDADDPVFLPPGDMPVRICSWLSARDLPAPSTPAQLVRCILDSLALAYRRALLDAQSLSGRHADVVHIVGGGARNDLLCQLTADATGLPVVAGPAEATALGNVLVQARALGAAPATLPGMRAILRSCLPLRTFSPAGDGVAWERAAARLV